MSFAMSSEADVRHTGVFGQAMGLVATTLGMFTLGAYLGRHLAGGPSLICFILGLVCVFGLNYARNSGGGAVGLLSALGLFLGLGLGGGIDAYTSADPGVVWQAGAATALFVAALGSIGYMTRSDLSGGYRALFFLLLGLIVYGLVTLFVSMPAANVIYAVLGLGIFGGYTLLDFNRLRQAGTGDAVSIACGIFLDVLNVFTFFLQLFGRGRED
jgi:FtsH-binding integral membrane protein